MSTTAHWLGRAERMLDAGGRPAWIAAPVGGFIPVWPLGLALLGYMIWSGRLNATDRKRAPSSGRRFRETLREAKDRAAASEARSGR